MLGTIVNVAAIVFGSAVGLLIKRGVADRFKTTLLHALALCVLMLGAAAAVGGLAAKGSQPVLFIISLVIGGLVGEGLRLEERLEAFGARVQRLLGQEGAFSQGFVAASLLYCVGSMAILGSLQSGLRGVHDILFAKAILDGVASVMLASTFGPGVALSAVSVLLYQGAITLFARAVSPHTTAGLIRELSIVGGVLIFGIGLNMMELKKIKIANLLPALIVPVVYFLPVVQRLLGRG